MNLRPLPFALLLLVIGNVGLAADPSAPTDHSTSLFNGKNLDGWVVRGCKAGVEEGLLVIQGGDGLVHTDDRYRDFAFSWECRPRREANWDSGIYFRCELPKGKPWPKQYQVNLRQGQEGELIGFKQTKGTTKQHIRPGEWNQFLLTVVGTTAKLQINGKQAWAVKGIEAEEGFVALQVEVPGGGQFEFRKLAIKEYPDSRGSNE